MTGYVGPIESQTLKNTYFRRVLFTGKPDGTVHKTKNEAEADEAAKHYQVNPRLPHRRPM